MPDDARRKMEDQWFARHEEDLLKQAQRHHEKRLADLRERQREGEERHLRELHYMKCPKCGHDMASLKIDDVEVDRCDTCDGIFLDKGELDAVLLKAAGERRGIFRRLMGL